MLINAQMYEEEYQYYEKSTNTRSNKKYHNSEELQKYLPSRSTISSSDTVDYKVSANTLKAFLLNVVIKKKNKL